MRSALAKSAEVDRRMGYVFNEGKCLLGWTLVDPFVTAEAAQWRQHTH